MCSLRDFMLSFRLYCDKLKNNNMSYSLYVYIKFRIGCVGVVKGPVRLIMHSSNSDASNHMVFRMTKYSYTLKLFHLLKTQTCKPVFTKTQFVEGCWYCLTIRFYDL